MASITDCQHYILFKHVLSGCKNSNDALLLLQIYAKNNNDCKKYILPMINGKKYTNTIDIEKIISTMNKYKNENLKQLYSYDHGDAFQHRILNKIIHTNKEIKMKTITITKYCPHCSRQFTSNNKMTYVVCGYYNDHNGYDWKGCQNDWCFSCGKKLCHSWNDNKLYLELNRHHNNECCKNHALKNKKDYENDYCQCNNEFVKRC